MTNDTTNPGISPEETTKQVYQRLLKAAKEKCPDFYYYKDPTFHVEVHYLPPSEMRRIVKREVDPSDTVKCHSFLFVFNKERDPKGSFVWEWKEDNFNLWDVEYTTLLDSQRGEIERLKSGISVVQKL